MNIVLAIGLILSIGLFGSLVLRKVGLPSVTGYIIIGIILGPSVLGLIPSAVIGQLDVLTNVTLAVVAYLIGGSLRLDSLRGLGRVVLWVTPLQSIGAWALVTGVLSLAVTWVMPEVLFWETTFPMALIIGAISSATAPAATMAIIRELRARGPLTTTLLAVVALDDGIAVIAFALAVGVAAPLAASGDGFTAGAVVFEPVGHIALSLALGAVTSIIPIYGRRVVRGREAELALVFGTVTLCAGVAVWLGLSLIIANMLLGFIVVNVLRRTDEHSVLGDIETLLYTLFFVLAGLHFNLGVLATAGVIAVVIVLARCTGKYLGTALGAWLGGALWK